MTESLVLQLLVMAVSGLSAAVGGLVLRRISDVREDLQDLVRKIQEHGESLADGRRRFEEMERRLGEAEREVRQILTDGCARARRCAVGGDAG